MANSTQTVEIKQVAIGDGQPIRLRRLLDWLGDGPYGLRAVEFVRHGDVVAVMASGAFGHVAAELAGRYHRREQPYEQAALDAWTADVLGAVDVGDLRGGGDE